MNAIWLSAGGSRAIGGEHVERKEGDDGAHVHVRDIERIQHRAAGARALYCERGVPWARATRVVDAAAIRHFEL